MYRFFKVVTTKSSQVQISASSIQNFIVGSGYDCIDNYSSDLHIYVLIHPDNANVFNQQYGPCSPGTQYFTVRSAEPGTTVVYFDIVATTPATCPNCCGGVGQCDTNTLTCSCPTDYVRGNDCSSKFCCYSN